MATSTATAGINTPADFARSLLATLGAPASSGNVDAIVAWEAAEGGHWNNSRQYNPMNTTYGCTPGTKGSISVADCGGQQGDISGYRSWTDGVQATADTLLSGTHGYPAILSALMKGDDPAGVAQAIVSSDWGTHHIDLGNADYSPSTATSQGGKGGVPGNPDNYDPSAVQPKDWIQTLEGVMNPSFGWNPFGDAKGVAQLAVTRGGLAAVGLLMIGGGIMLAFGKNIFGGAIGLIPGGGAVEAAASRTRRAEPSAAEAAPSRPAERAAA